MIKIISCLTLVLTMTLSQHRITLRKLAVNWLREVWPRETQYQHAIQLGAKLRLQFQRSREKDGDIKLTTKRDQI